MNCGDCRYSHNIGTSLLCWGEKEAPEVSPDHWCKSWKPKSVSAWTSPQIARPDPFISVQVYIPSQAPFPTVREGYIIDSPILRQPYWYVPALSETFDLDEVRAWKEFEEPTGWENMGILHGT